MRKRSTFCRPVSSVRLSVTFVYCIQTAKDVKLLYNSGSLVLLFFLNPRTTKFGVIMHVGRGLIFSNVIRHKGA